MWTPMSGSLRELHRKEQKLSPSMLLNLHTPEWESSFLRETCLVNQTFQYIVNWNFEDKL